MINFHGQTTINGDAIGRDKHIRGNVFHGDKVKGSRARQDTVANLIIRLKSELAALDIPINRKLLGQGFINQLASEFTKETAPPDMGIIYAAQEWFLEKIPDLAETMKRISTHPDIADALSERSHDDTDPVR